MQEYKVNKENEIEKEKFKKFFETRDLRIRNELVEDHLYMVDILIRKYLKKGIDRDDLYQVGAMALISAVERFDPNKGFEFSSFATPTILGEIKKYFRDKGWSMKVPRSLKEISVALPKAKDDLTSRLGRIPNVKEIAEYMKIEEDELLRAMESGLAYDAYSLNQSFDEDGETSEGSRYEKFTATEEKGYERLENYEIIEKALDSLGSTDRYVFRQRFFEEKSQSEIAKVLGVSQMTISRIEKKIKERIASELNK